MHEVVPLALVDLSFLRRCRLAIASLTRRSLNSSMNLCLCETASSATVSHSCVGVKRAMSQLVFSLTGF